jgi:hypothetical protein
LILINSFSIPQFAVDRGSGINAEGSEIAVGVSCIVSSSVRP